MAENNDNELAKSDAVFDQLHAEIRDAARADVREWERFSRKIDRAANSRVDCQSITFTREEQYRLVRLAHLASHLVTGRLLGRDL